MPLKVGEPELLSPGQKPPSGTSACVDAANNASQTSIASPAWMLILRCGVADAGLTPGSVGPILVAARNPQHIWASCSKAAPNQASCTLFREDLVDRPTLLPSVSNFVCLSTLGAALPCLSWNRSSRSFHEVTVAVQGWELLGFQLLSGADQDKTYPQFRSTGCRRYAKLTEVKRHLTMFDWRI